ncbi:AzlC family ABC transporter permease [Chitinimonas arctica]|uniref:AzlC family ABC transporter permease n=1 Tax=Chitinimonas arctica TaxID=2594795 RepID=A0A516S9P4_9NEIS|nr:AzlC family ABC transporter permease [Chitinimonas arctica]QDQ24880.1 AzlC family ABC transporter permease [Chitinimonas arctica]
MTTFLASPRGTELWRGACDSLPMLLGAAPFGVIFGTLAAPSGLSMAGALGMSLFVFAGSSQFIALTLMASGAGLAVIVLTTFVVNLRHALYSATLLPYVAALGQRWRLPLAFWLTDETFAVVQHRYGAADASPFKHWYHLGSSLAMYGNWLLWTLAGVLLGHSVEGLERLGLEFAMAATFTGIVVPMLKKRPMVGAALAAAMVALAARDLPYKLGLMLAAVAGVLVGLYLEERAGEAK